MLQGEQNPAWLLGQPRDFNFLLHKQINYCFAEANLSWISITFSFCLDKVEVKLGIFIL